MSAYSIEAKNEEAMADLLKVGLLSLVSENQRPSIRYLGEWVLSLLAGSNPGIVIPKIDGAFRNAMDSRLSAVPSFLSVFTNVALADKTGEMLETSMKKVIPWSMAQHFGTRLTAQVNFLILFLFYLFVVKLFNFLTNRILLTTIQKSDRKILVLFAFCSYVFKDCLLMPAGSRPRRRHGCPSTA